MAGMDDAACAQAGWRRRRRADLREVEVGEMAIDIPTFATFEAHYEM